MAAGRPHGQHDPSLMSSLETTFTGVRRPGLAKPGFSITAGAGLAVSTAALLYEPPARQCCIAWAWCLTRTRYPERVRLTPGAWPSSRDVAGDGPGDTEPEGRSNAYVRDDRFERLS